MPVCFFRFIRFGFSTCFEFTHLRSFPFQNSTKNHFEALQAESLHPTTHSFPKGQKVEIKVSYVVFIAQKDSNVSQAVVAWSWLSTCRPSESHKSTFTGRIFVKYYSGSVYESLSRKLKYDHSLTELLSRRPKCFYYSVSLNSSRMRTVSDKSCIKYEITHFTSGTFFKTWPCTRHL